PVSISCGDPQRNKNYRTALYGSKKSDPVGPRACARYALSERSAPVQPIPPQSGPLRRVAGRLQAVVRQRTRLINQLHHLLLLSSPELALLVKALPARGSAFPGPSFGDRCATRCRVVHSVPRRRIGACIWHIFIR